MHVLPNLPDSKLWMDKHVHISVLVGVHLHSSTPLQFMYIDYAVVHLRKHTNQVT